MLGTKTALIPSFVTRAWPARVLSAPGLLSKGVVNYSNEEKSWSGEDAFNKEDTVENKAVPRDSSFCSCSRSRYEKETFKTDKDSEEAADEIQEDSLIPDGRA